MTNPLPDRRTMTLDRRPGRKLIDPTIHNRHFTPIEKFKQIIEIPAAPAPFNKQYPTPSTPTLNGTRSLATTSTNTSTKVSELATLQQLPQLHRGGGGTRNRSSSLEMILNPLITSTRTRL